LALEGTLRDFSLADIFQLIGLQRKTGVLTLRSPEDVVTVSFLDGRVVGADSLNKRLEDRLGQVLLKTEAVDKSQLDIALKTQMETLQRLGHILLHQGVLSREELRKALEQQILQIVFRVFRWQDGDYQFSQETSVDYDVELVNPLASESILMEGARMLDEWPIIEKKIPHRAMIFVKTSAAALAQTATPGEQDVFESFDLDAEPPPPAAGGSGRVLISPVERDILDMVDGLSTVDDIVRKSAHSDFDTCKALYTLLTRSVIRTANREELFRASQKVPAEILPTPATVRVPWLALPLAGLLAVSILLVPRNPMNPWLGPGPKLLPRLGTAESWVRLTGVWQVLHARAILVGSYPENLAELVRHRLLTPDQLADPWDRPYRYVLREQSVLLAGNNPSGVPDANLMLSRHLGQDSGDRTEGPGAVLLNP
jgi:hypothetical protein